MKNPVFDLSRVECNAMYARLLEARDYPAIAELAKCDLFFLLSVVLNRADANRDWLYDRCRDVEMFPDGRLDLWARGHYKSTIITFALTIQEILKDPDITIGIFSHTRPIAKAFLRQIMREFEQNEFLKRLFPDVLYAEPRKEAVKWSEDGGIVVKRCGNPKEATLEAWGLVDGQPTGRHFKLQVYDDVVSRESVTSPEMIDKTTSAWELSLNLGSEGGRQRYIGTRYHYNDTYRVMMDRGSVRVRMFPATDDGKPGGAAVLLSQTELEDKRRDMGPYTFSAQMLQNPKEDSAMGFQQTDIAYYFNQPERMQMNVAVLVDPAHSKKKGSDYTTMSVIGLHHDNNYYLLDGLRCRYNLAERTAALFALHRRWTPNWIGYERYGLQSDIEHIRYVQEQESYRFGIIELGGAVSKEERIRRLVPVMRQGRFYVPTRLLYTDHEGKTQDYVVDFTNELLGFPVGLHDDVIDGAARVLDGELGAQFPKIRNVGAPGLTPNADKVRSGWKPL